VNDHLDAEIVAAWLDGSLDAGERTRAEAHAADCDRCRAVLAAMIRTEPPVPHRGWFSIPAVRWLAPLATAAVVLVVWSVSVARRSPVAETTLQTAAPSSSAAPSASIGPAPTAVPPPAPSTPQAAPLVLPKQESTSQMRPAEPVVRQERLQAKRRADAPAAPAPPASLPDRPLAAGRGGVPGTATGAAAGGVSADAAKPIDATARVQLKPPTAAPEPARDRAVAAAPPPPPPPPPPRPANEVQPGVMTESVIVTSRTALTRFTTTDVRAPGTEFQWRVGPAGRIEHSANGGKTWTRQASGVTTDLHAGAAPSPDVCWVVGRAGVVLRSTDRRTWRRIAFPETVDLIAVTATDAATASVTAVDGRVFRTSDGGKTWTH